MIKHDKAILIVIPFLFLSAWLSGQTIVSTSVEDQNTVLEEFGGMFCVYCPNAHQVVNDLLQTYGEDLVVLNYHTGPFAEPISGEADLTSPYGSTIEDLTGLTGYPAGMINRQVFEGYEQGDPGTRALNRAYWGEIISSTNQQTAVVNIAAEATLDLVNRELDLLIEYYYTADVVASNNRLHVAVLQNNILAPQIGGGAGNYYSHNYVVRDFLTGAEGHIITNTSAGTFGSLTYTLALPDNYNSVNVDPVNIEFAIFITDETEEVLNGIKYKPTMLAYHTHDAHLLTIFGEEEVCSNTEFLNPVISIRNDGNEAMEALTVRYGITGVDSNEISWEGHLEFLEEAYFQLPSCAPDPEISPNLYFVELIDPNGLADDNYTNNRKDHSVDIGPTIEGNEVEVVVRTDDYGHEVYWEITDETGFVHASGGNEIVGQTTGGAQIAVPTDPGAYVSNTFIVETVYLSPYSCYTFRILDDYADGLCCNYGNGFFRLRLPDQVTFISGGEFGAVAERKFSIEPMVNNTEQVDVDEIKPILYPNPVRIGETVFLKEVSTQNLWWSVLNSNGQLVASGSGNEIPSSTFLPGFYTVRWSDKEKVGVLPLVIQR